MLILLVWVLVLLTCYLLLFVAICLYLFVFIDICWYLWVEVRKSFKSLGKTEKYTHASSDQHSIPATLAPALLLLLLAICCIYAKSITINAKSINFVCYLSLFVVICWYSLLFAAICLYLLLFVCICWY